MLVRQRLLVLFACFSIGTLLVLFNLTKGTGEPAAIPTPTLEVTAEMQGRDLILQLKTEHFRFSRAKMGQDNVYGEGHAHLYVDGRKVAKIFGHRYVLPDLPPGTHRIKVELAHHDHTPYGVAQTLDVTVK